MQAVYIFIKTIWHHSSYKIICQQKRLVCYFKYKYINFPKKKFLNSILLLLIELNLQIKTYTLHLKYNTRN